MAPATMTALFSHARKAAIWAALVLAFAPSALAVGGNDASPSTKVNAVTQVCQNTIATYGANYAAKAAAAMNACLDAVVKCDEQADAAKALTCRRVLLVPTTGKCAVGKVDEGASMLGNGAALHADTLSTSKAVLLSQMRTYSNTLQKKCFTPLGVDLASIFTGLSFSPTPADKLALADATNQDPGGIQCLANGLVLKTHPLADEITQLVEDLHGQCVVSKDLTKLGTVCTVNTDCDGAVAASGRCGALAKVFRQGSIKPCAAPPPGVAVCGNGTAEFPEQCDDGNVLNGDGCSSTCTIEVPITAVGQRLKTGQTSCYNVAGAVIACAGTGQDGELQKGLATAYVDNGETITDTKTGLIWEKLDLSGSVHDAGHSFTWATAFSSKITALNTSPCFAGHCDWRLPNVKELESLIDYGRQVPAVDPAFNTDCVPGCTVATCSCPYSPTYWPIYWSSTTFVGQPSQAWVVDFYNGTMGPISTGIVADLKTNLSYVVRAVRGGP